MTIGQALAMMRSAEQFKDYQNQLNAQPAIDWRDVTQQAVGPQAPSYPVYQAKDVVVTADRPAPEPQYEEPVGPPDQYVVESPIAGEPYVPAASASVPFDYSAVLPSGVNVEPSYRDFSEPVETGYATRPPQQPIFGAMLPSAGSLPDSGREVAQEVGPGVYNLPPIAVPYYLGGGEGGPDIAMARERRRKKKPEAKPAPEEVTPPAQDSLATEFEPTLGITPELSPVQPQLYDTDVALREQISSAAMAQQPLAKPIQQEKTAWKPGQPFTVNVQIGGKNYEGTVSDFPDTPGAPVNVKVGAGTIPVFEDQDPDMYAAIKSRRDELAAASAPKDDFTSEVRVGDQWLPAKIDERTGRIIYKYTDPEAKYEYPVVYTQKSVLDLTDDDFRGPTIGANRYDNRQLLALQAKVANPLEESLLGLEEIKTGYRGTDPVERIRQNLMGKLGDGDAENPIGTMSWTYRTPNGVVPLAEAEKLGYVPAGTETALNSEYKTFIVDALKRADTAKTMQTGEPLTASERQIKEIKKAIKALEEARAKTTDQKEIDSLDKQIKEKNKELLKAETKTSNITNLSGGIQLIEEGEDVYTFGLNPMTKAGIFDLLAGAPAAPNPQVKNDRYSTYTEGDIANNVTSTVLDRLGYFPIADDPNFANAINAVQQRARQIEQDLTAHAKKTGVRPSDLLRQPVRLDIPELGYPSVTLPDMLKKLRDLGIAFQKAARSGDPALASAAKAELANYAKDISKAIFVPQLSSEDGRTQVRYGPSPAETYLQNLERAFAAPVLADYRSSRPVETTPGTFVKQAPKQTAVKENVYDEDVPNAQPWYPVTKMTTLAPGGKNGLVNSEFKLWEFMSRPEVAAGIAGKLDNAASTTFSTQEISHALGNDAGQPLSTQDLAALDQTVNKFNQFMASDDGRAARKQYFTALLTMVGNLGYPVTSSSGIETKFGIAEQAREAARKGDTNEVLKLRKQFYQNVVGKFGHSKNIQFVLDRTAGYQSAQLAKSFPSDYGSNIRFPSGEASNSRLYDNMVQSQMDIFDLITSSGTGATSIPTGSGRTVTWFVNPANPNVVNTHIPAIAMPSSIKGDRSGPTPIKSAEKKVGDADVMDGVVKDMDPALTAVLLSVGSIFGGGLMTPIIEGWSKINDPLIDIAQRNYREGGVAADGGGRDYSGTGEARKENKNVAFLEDSRKSVSSHSLNALMAGNIFPKNRDRKSDQIPGMLFKGITTK